MKEKLLVYTGETITGGLILAAAAAFIDRKSMTLSMALVACAATLVYCIVMDINKIVVKGIHNRVILILWYLVVTGVLSAAFAVMGSFIWGEGLTYGYFLGSFIGVLIARLAMTAYRLVVKFFK